MLGIINYGMGNLTSVQNALNYLGISNKIISESSEVYGCDKLILPGVGAFGLAMQKLKDTGFSDALREFVLIKERPILGICLGMQLFLETSIEHGTFEGLGFVKGHVKDLGGKISTLPIPHMGWNTVISECDSVLLRDDSIHDWNLYFVHSYYCDVSDKTIITGKTKYGFEFDAMYESGNIFAVQFHPEKSQKCGLALLSNFAKV